jgi:hypothetical protein
MNIEEVDGDYDDKSACQIHNPIPSPFENQRGKCILGWFLEAWRE